jgi:hypothetical protein
MIPTFKSKEIESFLTKLSGVDRKESITANKCTMCKGECKSEDFRDNLSLKEYFISGMCQKCQDEIFQDVQF